MIFVIATISIQPGKRDEFLNHFRSLVPLVRAEAGCIEYVPATDLNSGLELQSHDTDRVIVLEKWESLDHLHAHLKAPHMDEYRKNVADLVRALSLDVLTPADTE